MISALVVALFQTVAGNPAEPVEAQQQSPPAIVEPVGVPTQQASLEPQDPRHVRRCRTETLTESRVRRIRVCRSQAQDDATARDAYRAMQDAAAHGGPGAIP